MGSLCLVLLLLFTSLSLCSASTAFSTWLDSLIGLSHVKAYLRDKTTWVARREDPKKLVNDRFAPQLKQLLQPYYNQIRNVSAALEEDYKHNKYNTRRYRPNCDSLHKNEYNTTSACDNAGAVRGEVWWPSDDVTEVMRDNFNADTDLHLYYGTYQGAFTTLPAQHCDCSRFDPRKRPWYANSMHAVSKCIVLLLDSSFSLGFSEDQYGWITRMSKMKEAAMTVVDLLSRKDKVTVISMNKHIHTYTKERDPTNQCFSQKLATATERNKGKMKTFISNMMPRGRADLREGMDKAFSFFDTSKSNATLKCETKIILLILDGFNKHINDDSQFVEYVKKTSKSMNIKLVTYVTGNELDDKFEGVLRSICFTGGFNHVTNMSMLPALMPTYYESLNTNMYMSNSISRPYIGYVDKFPMISMCRNAYSGSRVIGVVCADIPLVRLSNITDFPGQNSDHYPFLMDSDGWIIYHPLITHHLDSKETDFRVSVHQLECQHSNHSLLKELARRTQVTGLPSCTKRTVPLGGQDDGVRYEPRNSRFWCKEFYLTDQWFLYTCLSMDDSTFLSTDYNLIKAHHVNKEVLFSFYGHEGLQYTRQNRSRCKNLSGWVASEDFISFTYTFRAFKDPMEFLRRKKEDREKETRDIELQILYGQGPEPLKHGLKNVTEALMNILHKLWMGDLSSYQYFMWRFLCTENGILAQHPASEMQRPYDCTTMPWYRRAKADPEKMILTPFQRGKERYLISVSHALCLKLKDDPRIDQCEQMLGVIVADFTPEYILQKLKDNVEECRRPDVQCLLMDDQGTMVIHDHSESFCNSTYQKVHITSKDAAIAQDLIRKKILVQKTCKELLKAKILQWWEVKLPRRQRYYTGFYEIRPLPHTNLYLIMKNISTAVLHFPCPCLTEKLEANRSQACILSPGECECPCYRQDENYDLCDDQYNKQQDYSVPICASVGDDLLEELDNKEYVDSLRPQDKTPCYKSRKEPCPAS